MARYRLALASALLLAAAPAFADEPAPPAGGPTVLHLTQTAERKVVRDVLHAELRAEKSGAEPQAIQSAINEMMAKALVEAKQVPGIEVTTAGYTVNRDGPTGGPTTIWVGRQSLSLAGKDSGALLKLVGALQGAGLVISNLTYDTAPETVHAAENALTAEALADLAKRANAIAGELHLSMLGYRDLVITNAQVNQPVGLMMAERAMVGSSTAVTPPVAAPGEAIVRVMVTAQVLLGAKQP